MNARGDSLKRGVASLVILAVLGLQVTAVAGSVGWFLWPFADYPMYRAAHHAGERVSQYALIGILPNGAEVPIDRKAFGFNVWQLQKEVIGPMTRREPTVEDRRKLGRAMAHYEATHGRRLQALRLEDEPVVVTRQGLVPGAAAVVGTFDRSFWSVE